MLQALKHWIPVRLIGTAAPELGTCPHTPEITAALGLTPTPTTDLSALNAAMNSTAGMGEEGADPGEELPGIPDPAATVPAEAQ